MQARNSQTLHDPTEPPNGDPDADALGALIARLCLHWRTLGYESVKATANAQSIFLDAQAQDAPEYCPACGTPCPLSAPASYLQVHDLPIEKRRVTLRLRRRSQRCMRCRAAVESPLPGIDAERGITHRLASSIAAQFDRPIRILVLDTGVRQSVVRDIVQPAAEACFGRRPGYPNGFEMPGTKASHHVTSPGRHDVYLRLTQHKPPCPNCGSSNVQRSATHERHLHDRPHHGKTVALVFKQYRIFRCLDCMRNYGEPVPGVAMLPRHPRLTQRLVEWICEHAGTRTEHDIAAQAGIPVGSIRRVLAARGEPGHTFQPQEISVPGWQPLPGMIATRYSHEPSGHHVHLRATMPAIRCAGCGSHTVVLRWRRARTIRDVPVNDQRTTLYYSGIIVRCRDCGHAAEQAAAGLDTTLKVTDRLKQWIAARLPDDAPLRIAQDAGLRLAQLNMIARRVRRQGRY